MTTWTSVLLAMRFESTLSNSLPIFLYLCKGKNYSLLQTTQKHGWSFEGDNFFFFTENEDTRWPPLSSECCNKIGYSRAKDEYDQASSTVGFHECYFQSFYVIENRKKTIQSNTTSSYAFIFHSVNIVQQQFQASWTTISAYVKTLKNI